MSGDQTGYEDVKFYSKEMTPSKQILLQQKAMYKALPNCLHVKDSPVAGQGLFATQDIPNDVYLGISHVVVDDDIMRTPLGGFVNHSDDPNCTKDLEEMEWGRIYHIRTIKDIKKGEELFLKYTFYQISQS